VTGAIFAIMAGAYYWLPKWTGYMYNETLGKWHFWLSTIFVNVLFFPQHFLGLAGMQRRVPDYNPAFADFNMWSSIGGFGFGLSQLLFVYIVWQCARGGVKAEARSWPSAKGLEWTVPSPAPLPRPRSSVTAILPTATSPTKHGNDQSHATANTTQYPQIGLAGRGLFRVRVCIGADVQHRL
jgi:heme/copper-type cytochrome/quinol oxidase subunit 1